MKDSKNSLVPYHSDFGLNTYNNQFNSLVERLFDSFWETPSFQLERNWRPTDISEDENSYKIEIELPGFSKKDITVTTQGNTLKVSAKNNKSSYSRVFAVGGWDLSKLTNRLENGVLFLSIEKTPEAKEKVIEINEKRE